MNVQFIIGNKFTIEKEALPLKALILASTLVFIFLEKSLKKKVYFFCNLRNPNQVEQIGNITSALSSIIPQNTHIGVKVLIKHFEIQVVCCQSLTSPFKAASFHGEKYQFSR